MDYKKITIEEFIEVTAGKDPVPGGGSVSALAGTLAASLGKMVTGLTIGRKKYVDVQADMEAMVPVFTDAIASLLQAIADDADAYDQVFNAYKLPKETDQEKALRSEAIRRASPTPPVCLCPWPSAASASCPASRKWPRRATRTPSPTPA